MTNPLKTRDSIRAAINAADALQGALLEAETKLALHRDEILAANEGRTTCGFFLPYRDRGPECTLPLAHEGDHRLEGVSTLVHSRSWDQHWNEAMEETHQAWESSDGQPS